MKLTRDQVIEIRETLASPGFKLIQWQQNLLLEGFSKSLDSAKTDHRFYQGRKEGARSIIKAAEILLRRK